MATTKLKAVTLLEILVALIIISISMLGLSAGFTWTQIRNNITRRHLQAQNFSQDTLETLLVTITDYNDPALTTSVRHSTAAPTCDFAAQRYYDVGELIVNGEKQITVTTEWTEAGNTEQEILYGIVIQK